MSIYEWIGIGGSIAIVATLYAQIRVVVSMIYSRVVVTTSCTTELGIILISYLNKTKKSTELGDKYYKSRWAFVRPINKMSRIVLKVFRRNTSIYWCDRWPIWTSYVSGDATTASRCKFSFIRGTVKWEDLLLAAIDWEEEEIDKDLKFSNRYTIYRYYGSGASVRNSSGPAPGRSKKGTPAILDDDDDTSVHAASGATPLRWDYEDIGPPKPSSALNDLALSPEMRNITEEIDFWLHQEEWYVKRGIPWRRGYLFYGEPGTGKTSLARAIAQDFNMPISIFDLSSMSNEDFINAWNQTLMHSPCIALLEDLDSIFHGRENITADKEWSITFDCILNCIDGVERPNGLLLIVTTNRVDLLDAALGIPDQNGKSTRPGRIDRTVLFVPLDEQGRRKLAARIINDPPEEERLVQEGASDSAAQFQERCIQSALNKKFEEAKRRGNV
jgi:hypothetical protein